MLFIEKAIAPPASKAHAEAIKRRRPGYFYLGLVLVVIASTAFTFNLRLTWLGSLQADDLYKQLSGFALAAYLAHQWHCPVLRNRGLMRKACSILSRHKLIGSFAPLVFFAHSQTLGFGYLQIFSLGYFAVFVTGLFNVETTGIRKPWFQSLWVFMHVSLSTGLLFLLGYHLFISYAYK